MVGGKPQDCSLSLGGPQYNLKPGIRGIIFYVVLRLVGKSLTLPMRVTEDHGFRTGRIYVVVPNKEHAYCIT
jgi:hypothetical protein